MKKRIMIDVRELSHHYGKREALKNLSFSVKPNEIFGILGPNGSGKTTLFKLLSTQLSVTGAGEVVVGGETNLSKRRHFLGVVFQEASLDKKLSIRENLRHQGHLYKLSGKELRLKSENLLKTVGLLDRMNEKVENLSGGLKRRAEIAKALLHDPKILLLDEPTTGLDPGGRKDLWHYIEKLKSRGVTTLVTTHLMDEADRCDRLLILHEGEKVAEGTPAELKQSIGGEVMTLVSKDPQKLCQDIEKEFQINVENIDGILRCKSFDGEKLAFKLKEQFGTEIESMTLSKPSLEDVFIQKTGHRFWVEER